MIATAGPWTCDACGKPVTVAMGAIVTWENPHTSTKANFRIAHTGDCDRRIDPNHDRASAHLEHLLGADGQSHLLALLSTGPVFAHSRTMPVDADSFVDIFRRLHIPGYEEARPYFSTSAADAYRDAGNEIGPYTQHALRVIAEEGRASADD